jgi:ADP-L-glycero-D-manno-heptose 6-epimerase
VSSPKILLTGAAGLIGGATIRHLNSLGHTDIIAVDKLGSCPHKWRNLSRCHIADYIEYDDLRLDDLPASIDAVIHLGARSHTTETNAAFLIRNNYRFSIELAKWADAHRARFVYASSAATYGADTAMVDSDESEYLSSLRPLNAYGYSKHLFDLWMARDGMLDQGGLITRNGAVGLKYTNVYGPFERHKGEQRSLVCKAYDALCAGKPIELFESARPDVKTDEIRRDFIYVEDAAKITVWFALNDKGREAHGLFNVGSGVATSFTDLARFTVEGYIAVYGPRRVFHFEEAWRQGGIVAGKDIEVEYPYVQYVPMPEQLRARYQYYTCAPITKLRAAGYTEPFKSVEEGVREYVCDYLAKEIE